jgi:hypothetical protein
MGTLACTSYYINCILPSASKEATRWRSEVGSVLTIWPLQHNIDASRTVVSGTCGGGGEGLFGMAGGPQGRSDSVG